MKADITTWNMQNVHLDISQCIYNKRHVYYNSLFSTVKNRVTCYIYFTNIDVSKIRQWGSISILPRTINRNITTKGKAVDIDGVIQGLLNVMLVTQGPWSQVWSCWHIHRESRKSITLCEEMNQFIYKSIWIYILEEKK